MMSRRLIELSNGLLRRRGLEIRPLAEENLLRSLFYRNYHDDFFFIQVGANDGRRFDPIHDLATRHNLAGLAIEPLGDMFAALKATYQNHPRVKPVNLAVHRSETVLTLYRVRPDAQVPEWAHGIASVNPKHHELSGADPDLIIKETVPAASLKSIFETHNIRGFDLFLVDAEGYDAEIVRMLLETGLRPAIIQFEHGLQDSVMSREDFLDIVRALMQEGYYVATMDYDAIAYRLGPITT